MAYIPFFDLLFICKYAAAIPAQFTITPAAIIIETTLIAISASQGIGVGLGATKNTNCTLVNMYLHTYIHSYIYVAALKICKHVVYTSMYKTNN